ncbi:M14 family zinc carboxypeptidase [Kitasatospora sp. GP82]|uniref:M14 family zinc carboxypeptidase n=1 Tax=Kitasatospora sp. GP82 TaxID=3035089 RepID=UPI0024736F64|nr:M14 family zinc carboxypeptidase [Kitasatospora sp. GP82]
MSAVAALTAVALPALPQASASASSAARAIVFRVPVRDASDPQKLLAGGFDVLERRQGNDLFVLGDAAAGARLHQLGFTWTVDRTLPGGRTSAQDVHAADVNDTYYGGYHTVNAHYTHLDQTAAQHPGLATVVTYGQSWRKQNGQPNGYDLKAICITKLTQGDCRLDPNPAKPRFFLMSQIHAREITTGEVSWRWIDYLTGNYGTDPTVTALMDSTEMWVVPIANPDGVDIVQQGGDNPNLQRKNADDTNGTSCGWNGQTGIDLNRNTNSHWGASGTSDQPCDETYPGPDANSETENSALENLFRNLYPAVRGTGDTTPAPVDTRGVMITMHSDASMVLFPWGFDHTVHTGNDAALRAMAARLGSITGYQYGQPGEILYDAAGTTDDWTYDKLGLASFTIEVGDSDGRGCDGFLPPYSCQDSYFWPKLQPALLYAAQHAAAPYRTASDG